MNRHPAHQLARSAELAAEELRTYANPDEPFPRELTEDDHHDLLPPIRKAIADLAESINRIARATTDEGVKEMLTESARHIETGCDGIDEAQRAMEDSGPEAEPDTTMQPAALAASSFPHPITAGALQRAATTPAPPGATVAAPRPGQASPGQTQ